MHTNMAAQTRTHKPKHRQAHPLLAPPPLFTHPAQPTDTHTHAHTRCSEPNKKASEFCPSPLSANRLAVSHLKRLAWHQGRLRYRTAFCKLALPIMPHVPEEREVLEMDLPAPDPKFCKAAMADDCTDELQRSALPLAFSCTSGTRRRAGKETSLK
ncbi:uncharacterized protein K452DRAFT_64939 [Aplosporella prunicola CBS 121167]|uniref:Uncharacterized protein n=1 Tax=Aplosporella prunicola CBS 121167 TaxID=1176127 RepID=A0A6A6B8Q0_9PEZI|nr:uncharacterized protein K452DRAFT_64939 [Aplosporella prunicola CBS 121167]KAF2139743.1 hypothetical protein K452DRAFT_64939 [Aplosporella prunicola CBS 121167]